MAMAIGASYEKTDQFAAAVPFYREAMENLELEQRVVYREDLRVVLLDRIGQCYKQAYVPSDLATGAGVVVADLAVLVQRRRGGCGDALQAGCRGLRSAEGPLVALACIRERAQRPLQA